MHERTPHSVAQFFPHLRIVQSSTKNLNYFVAKERVGF
jgi:hypothetical protein